MEVGDVTTALLWSISGGVFVILCFMIAITCLLVKRNFERSSQVVQVPSKTTVIRGGEDGQKLLKVNRTVSMDNDQYLKPRTGVSGLRPKLPSARSPVRHSSPSSSLDQHIYDDPDYIQSCAKQGKVEHIYDNDTENSGSQTSSNYDKVHDYANTKGGVGLRC